MTRNGTSVHRSPTSSVPIGAAFLAAETTGQLPAEAWPAIRDLLLATADPQLAAAIEPLRQLLQARQAVVLARLELDRGYAAVAAAGQDADHIAEAAANLSLLADELAARAQQLAGMHNG